MHRKENLTDWYPAIELATRCLSHGLSPFLCTFPRETIWIWNFFNLLWRSLDWCWCRCPGFSVNGSILRKTCVNPGKVLGAQITRLSSCYLIVPDEFAANNRGRRAFSKRLDNKLLLFFGEFRHFSRGFSFGLLFRLITILVPGLQSSTLKDSNEVSWIPIDRMYLLKYKGWK